MFRNAAEFADEFGIPSRGRSDAEALAAGIAQNVLDMGDTGVSVIDIELQDDAVLIHADERSFELKYPFNDDAVQAKINAIVDGEPGDL